jgi:hypothetical protein
MARKLLHCARGGFFGDTSLQASYGVFWEMGASYEFFFVLILIGCLPILFFAVFLYLEHISSRPRAVAPKSEIMPMDRDIEAPAGLS